MKSLGIIIKLLTIVAGALSWAVADAQEPPALLAPRPNLAVSSFADVIKKSAPAVVNVYSTKVITSNPGVAPFYNNPLFHDFFNENSNGVKRPMRSRSEQSLGSGVIVTADGYILTNFHVVEDAQEVQVVLANGESEFTARVVGTDSATDLAVLKINTANLPIASFGDSDHSQIGDVVLAIGNPFGVGQTVTLGIISAIGRGGFGIVDYEDFIQTDAAINPGNSGGALVDSQGQVVGINTAILTASRGGYGIGFAVPINLARYVMEQIIRNGKVSRGLLGVAVQPLTASLAGDFKAPDQNGALVGDVSPGSPAEKGGLKPGDVILGFNGHKVLNPRQLRLMMGEIKPGGHVDLTVLRDGAERRLTAVLAEVPGASTPPKPQIIAAAKTQSADLLDGVTVTDVDAATRAKLEMPVWIFGVVVLEIQDDCAAFLAGLRVGDVIQEIERHPIKDSQEALFSSRKASQKEILLRVWTKGNSHYVSIAKDQRRRLPTLGSMPR